MTKKFSLNKYSFLRPKNVFLFALFLAWQTDFAQIFPNYSERLLLAKGDSLNLQTNLEIATEGNIEPSEYFVGPGDKLFISIRGIEEIINKVTIDQEGAVYIPKVGGLNVRNFTLLQTKKSIDSLIRLSFKNVQVFISLSEVRKIKVSLNGDIKKQASFNIYANSRLNELLSKQEILTQTSNLRNIKIIHSNGIINYYDHISYLRLGSKKDNPYLQEGDFIFVDKTDKHILIFGAVKFPGLYEFKENESVIDIINIAGGFLAKARKDSIELIRFKDDHKSEYSIYSSFDELQKKNIILKNKDKIVVREIPRYLIDNFVIVDGFVNSPGVYKIIDNETNLSEIIKQAGGFLKDASLVDAQLKRDVGTEEDDPEFERLKTILRADMTDDEYDYFKSKSRQRKGKVVVDFIQLFEKGNKLEDVALRRNDIITIPEKKNYIIMLGQVLKPGNITFQSGLTVDDYIKLSGGYGWRALKSDVRVIKANTGEWIDASDAKNLQPGDAIWVPEDPPPPKFWTIFKDILIIFGQIATVIAATTAVIVSTR